ncbi:unnamed protein product [Haemonchus placei]|uniref:GCFC domain-containing protein n=1 Tax=Haemonchus placei TaxID=6290 RepID=A0A0N4W0X0_HAEPC|nr:unnamed protein product [Haemonchus placei]
MFRKPKVKGTVRKRTDGWDDNQEQDVETPVPKPPALLSFDNDEGADADFVLKKNKKKVKELKRIQKLEEEAEKERIREEEERKKELEREKEKKKKSREKEREKERRDAKSRYLDKYRDCSSKVSSLVIEYFPAEIPDSRAVYEAKKRRERLVIGNFSSLTLKHKKGTRARLIREDENDDSDEETPKFYSKKDMLRDEEQRRREEQGHFLEQEQGDERDADEEADEWEKQQILKAVSRHTVYSHVSHFMRCQFLFDFSFLCCVDFFYKLISLIRINFLVNRNYFPLSITEREERLNARQHEVEKIENTLQENKATIAKIESDMPVLASKYTMYQELRIYCRSLLNCLNEKVCDTTFLLLSVETNSYLGSYAMWFRARRRREREGTLAGVSHEEGLSSDDDEPTSQQLADQQAAAEIDTALNMVFVDALDDYSHLRKVLNRMVDWFAVDGTTFQDAYISLCIPKLASPYVRIELITADILNRDDFILSAMPWYTDCIRAIQENNDVDQNHEVLTGIIPSIIDKVVLPFLTDVVNVEWEPMSLKQSKRLGAVLSGLSDYPKMNIDDSKSFAILATAVKTKIASAIDDDLMCCFFGQAILVSHQGVQWFFFSIQKLIRGLRSFSSFLNPATRFELMLDGVINRVCVVALETGLLDDITCERKVKALIAEIPDEMIESAKPDSLRNLIRCLGRVVEEQKAAGRSSYRDVRKYLEKLQKKADESAKQS